jgi:hypothetical protein
VASTSAPPVTTASNNAMASFGLEIQWDKTLRQGFSVQDENTVNAHTHIFVLLQFAAANVCIEGTV